MPRSTIISIWNGTQQGEMKKVNARNESNRNVRSAQGDRYPGVGDSIQDDKLSARSGGGASTPPPFFPYKYGIIFGHSCKEGENYSII